MSTPSAIIVGVGAEQGLGAALCRLLADKGYHVVIAGRTRAKIDQVAASIKASGGSAEAVETDATDEAAVIRLFEHAFSARDDIAAPDFVVFNAGINRPIGFRDLTAAQFEEFWRICCFGGFFVGREAARHLAPLGLHVAHTIIDGGIDGERLRSRRPDVDADGLLNIDAIAESYWHIHRQHPSAWTQELDLRPYKENF